MKFIINPGTAPVTQVRELLAAEAILVFVDDLNRPETGHLAGVTVARHAEADGDGWFGFKLLRGRRSCIVAMPGLSLDHTRNHPEGFGQRLYVDGNSWWWHFALNTANRALRGEP